MGVLGFMDFFSVLDLGSGDWGFLGFRVCVQGFFDFLGLGFFSVYGFEFFLGLGFRVFLVFMFWVFSGQTV